jgi:hypothetical protein
MPTPAGCKKPTWRGGVGGQLLEHVVSRDMGH